MTPLEQWLSDATRGLSTESAARVREEIQQHYDSACEAGDDALAALGDPRYANRAYRKVLLTEQEAMLAPALAQSKRRRLQSLLLGLALMALILWPMGKHHGPGFWPITAAILCFAPFYWLFPPNTLERSRTNIYITAVRDILLVAIFWWFYGWMGALSLGAILFSMGYFINSGRLSIFRKLAAGQTYSPLPGEPELSHVEAIHLRNLRKGSPYERVCTAVLFLLLTAMAVWQPASCGPMAAWIAAGLVAQRVLPIYTEERSRWFRIAKWTTMALAAVFPALYGARLPWIGAAYLAFFFVLFDVNSISLRRKLPAAQWPKRLYW